MDQRYCFRFFIFEKRFIVSLLQEQRCTEDLVKVLYRLVHKSTTVWVQVTSSQQNQKSKLFYDGVVLPSLQLFLWIEKDEVEKHTLVQSALTKILSKTYNHFKRLRRERLYNMWGATVLGLIHDLQFSSQRAEVESCEEAL